MEDIIVNNFNEEDFLKELKAAIEQGKRNIENGDFITHEQMLEELRNKKII
ncbi:hypothetical protein [Flavobacterium sp.]|uniref:hypothetical protein n=1 Tax=Flavobacterium sp. TaxID=239 RepID=UPI00374CC904